MDNKLKEEILTYVRQGMELCMKLHVDTSIQDRSESIIGIILDKDIWIRII